MQRFIVIGNPINHSKSPELHHAFAQSVNLPISYTRQYCPDDAESFLAVVQAFFAGGGTGANVTLPFKELAYQLCQQDGKLSERAFDAKAVNTLYLQDGVLYGDNTDGIGLVQDLLTKGVMLDQAVVGIIGAGGATRGVIRPLLNAGAKIVIYNRTIDKARALVEQFAHQHLTAQPLDALADTQFDLMINATSATTHGQSLPLQNCQAKTAYDMMYGKPSAFLAHFAAQNARCIDGLGMLVQQAALAFEIWTGKKVDLNQIDFGKLTVSQTK